MKIYYDESSLTGLRELAIERVESVKHLIPDWCHEVRVFFDTDGDPHNSAVCIPNYSYRFMQIFLNPNFFIEEDWKTTLIHEIFHAIFRPYVEFVTNLVEGFIQDEDLKCFLNNGLRDREESVVQDSAILVEKLLTNQQ